MTTSAHILVVDDEANLRKTVASILQRAGFQVTTAGNAREALSFLAEHSFDLVFMDIRMPDMNGLDALQSIHGMYPQLPVFLFTGQPDLSSAVSALRHGAVDYLQKPLRPEMLIERARTALAKLELERRRREIQAQIETLQAELKSLESNEEPKQPVPVGGTAEQEKRFLRRGNLTLDLHTRRVDTGSKKSIFLPPTSFEYLLVLARHAPGVVDYQTLVAEAQGYQASPREAQELVKWHIHHIRQAIERDISHPTFVINVRGSGYRLVTD